jgi:hypothetical protein
MMLDFRLVNHHGKRATGQVSCCIRQKMRKDCFLQWFWSGSSEISESGNRMITGKEGDVVLCQKTDHRVSALTEGLEKDRVDEPALAISR